MQTEKVLSKKNLRVQDTWMTHQVWYISKGIIINIAIIIIYFIFNSVAPPEVSLD